MKEANVFSLLFGHASSLLRSEHFEINSPLLLRDDTIFLLRPCHCVLLFSTVKTPLTFKRRSGAHGRRRGSRTREVDAVSGGDTRAGPVTMTYTFIYVRGWCRPAVLGPVTAPRPGRGTLHHHAHDVTGFWQSQVRPLNDSRVLTRPQRGGGALPTP